MENDFYNTVKSLLRSNSYWVLNKNVIKNLGVEPTLMLSVLAEADEMLADEDGWFYQTVETIEEMTGLSKYKQGVAIGTLLELGILEQQNKGVPPKRYFRINSFNTQRLILKLENNSTNDLTFKSQKISLLKGENLDVQKSKNLTFKSQKIRHNKEHSNKEHIYKKHNICSADCEEVLNFLNQTRKSLGISTKAYARTKANMDLINKALEKFSKDDIIKVINHRKEQILTEKNPKKNETNRLYFRISTLMAVSNIENNLQYLQKNKKVDMDDFWRRYEAPKRKRERKRS